MKNVLLTGQVVWIANIEKFYAMSYKVPSLLRVTMTGTKPYSETEEILQVVCTLKFSRCREYFVCMTSFTVGCMHAFKQEKSLC